MAQSRALAAVNYGVAYVLKEWKYPEARKFPAYLNDAEFVRIQNASFRQARRIAGTGLVTMAAIAQNLHDRNYWRISEQQTAAGWTPVPAALRAELGAAVPAGLTKLSALAQIGIGLFALLGK